MIRKRIEKMPKTIKGLFCPGLPLSIIPKKWIALNKEISEEWANWKDVPWWYNERAVLSVFAGAVWKSGNHAFEEFVDQKRKVSRKSGRFSRKYQGRVDLYWTVDAHEFIAEAKQCWSGASALNSETTSRITKILSKACADIRKSKPHKQRRLEIVFVVPYVRQTCQRYIDDRVRHWVKKFNKIDCDARV